MRMRAERFILALAVAAVVTTVPAEAQTARVTGFVKSESGSPITDATVTAENPQTSPRSFTATTDDRGRWSMIGLRVGMWTFTAEAPGYVPSQGAARVRAGAGTEPVEFTLVKGTVRPPSGRLAGINISELQKDLDAADALYDSGQYDRAITAYQAIIQEAPALTIVNLQIGNAYHQLKQYDRALAAYEKVLKADPASEKAKIAIGMTNMEKGDLDAAETTLTAAAEAAGASPEVFYTLGEVKFSKHQPDEAVNWYQKAHQADPGWGRPIYKLAMVALNRGDRDVATKYFEQVLAVDPNSPDAAQAEVALEQLRR